MSACRLPVYNLDGWPVDFRKLPSWARRDDKIITEDAIFQFFRCPCRKPRAHRIESCDFVQLKATPEELLEKRLHAATAPMDRRAL